MFHVEQRALLDSPRVRVVRCGLSSPCPEFSTRFEATIPYYRALAVRPVREAASEAAWQRKSLTGVRGGDGFVCRALNQIALRPSRSPFPPLRKKCQT
jgi:hypothetical protein